LKLMRKAAPPPFRRIVVLSFPKTERLAKMKHWHLGDRENLPRFVERLRQTMGPDGQGIELSIRPGASDLYEERFSYYWLLTGWSVFVFHAFAMVVVVVHMSTGVLAYSWLPHLAGTAIVDCGIAFMAIVYRFVLFPAPLYHSRSLSLEGMPAPGVMFGAPPPYPHAQFNPTHPGPGVAETGPNGTKGPAKQPV